MAIFDTYADGYQDSVERAVGFTGRNLEFFHQRKVDVLLRVGRRELGSMRTASVLDVGCGAGVTDALLRPHVGSLHGVEVSPAMVEAARDRNPDCAYDVYDGHHLPFDDATFDLVMTVCVLHHVPPTQWQSFADELARVTRPGGLIAIVEHNRLNPLTRRAVNRCEFDDDAVLVPQRAASRLLDRAGAGPTRIHNFLFSPLAGRAGDAIDRALVRLPLGGQYAAIARRQGTSGMA